MPVRPCKTCPYRKDVPVGVWDPVEFQNLLEQDARQFGRMFDCHGEIAKQPADRELCAGWLLDQQRRGLPSIALRMAVISDPAIRDQLERVDGEGIELYSSIERMCAANGVAPDGRIVKRLPFPKKRR